MEAYEIKANILMNGAENVAQFVLALADLIEEYGGELMLDKDSDVDIIYMTEEDEAGEWTLQDLYNGDIQ